MNRSQALYITLSRGGSEAEQLHVRLTGQALLLCALATGRQRQKSQTCLSWPIRLRKC